MAVTFNTFLAQAKLAKECMNDLKDLRTKNRQLIDHHNANGFSTAGDTPKPTYINENINGNIDTLEFSRQEYLDAVNLTNQLENFFTNAAVTTGDYKTVMEKIADA